MSGRMYHMAIAASVVLRVVRDAVARGEDWREFFQNVPAKQTWAETEAALVELGAKPLLTSECDNIDSRGLCGGHPVAAHSTR